jgi:hypothetical protein
MKCERRIYKLDTSHNIAKRYNSCVSAFFVLPGDFMSASATHASIAQEIMLVDVTANSSSLSKAERELAKELDRVNKQLERYTCNANKGDYALAVASGIVAGAVDSLFVGETHLFGDSVNSNKKDIAKKKTTAEDSSEIINMESILPENVRSHMRKARELAKTVGIEPPDVNEIVIDQLRNYEKQPTIIGLACAISLRLFDASVQNNQKHGRNTVLPSLSKKSAREMLVPAILTGFISWIDAIPEGERKDSSRHDLPKPISNLLHIESIRNDIAQISRCTKEWFSKQVKTHDKSKGGTWRNRSVGVGLNRSLPEMILSLFNDYAKLPMFEGTELKQYLLLVGAQAGLGKTTKDIPIAALDKQAVPVLLNEAIVRVSFFISRFATNMSEAKHNERVNWGEAVPLNNRTVDRMMAISSLTLSMVDTADAAVRASLESAGDWVIFSQKFVARYNFVATGRAAVAIVREVSNEAKEAELLRQKRILIESKVAFDIARLQQYQTQLEERLDTYLAEDLQAFFEGFSLMDRGLLKGDSNLVIGGNVVIQRVLGREPQFNNQEEFDALMESDEDFVF